MSATSTNGHGSAEAARRSLFGGGGPGGREAPETGGLLGALRRAVASRIPPADLDERDPDYIRESLPRLWPG